LLKSNYFQRLSFNEQFSPMDILNCILPYLEITKRCSDIFVISTAQGTKKTSGFGIANKIFFKNLGNQDKNLQQRFKVDIHDSSSNNRFHYSLLEWRCLLPSVTGTRKWAKPNRNNPEIVFPCGALRKQGRRRRRGRGAAVNVNSLEGATAPTAQREISAGVVVLRRARYKVILCTHAQSAVAAPPPPLPTPHLFLTKGTIFFYYCRWTILTLLKMK
jgi:hypothetical protein